ncbi:MAG: hypothetical protein P8Y36_13280 [Alphaproteobacteria bacterium]
MSMELLVTSGVQLVSTVLGVYLAARAAHKNTVDFEVIRSERDGYFMRAALLEELKDNIAAVDAWSAEFQAHLDQDPAIQANADALKENADPEILANGNAWVAWWKAGSAFRLTHINNNPSELSFSTLIWDALKQQTVTFQLPADFLSAVRRYYKSIASDMQNVVTRDRLERTQRAAVSIWQETRYMREKVVPAYEKRLAQVREELQRKGVKLDV